MTRRRGWHIHWHRMVGVHGLFAAPVLECRCGSRKYIVGWFG